MRLDITEDMAKHVDIYRVQQVWRRRRGVLVRRAQRPWSRTWQAEWEGCKRAPRAWTRNGVLVKAVRAYAASHQSPEEA